MLVYTVFNTGLRKWPWDGPSAEEASAQASLANLDLGLVCGRSRSFPRSTEECATSVDGAKPTTRAARSRGDGVLVRDRMMP